MAFPGSGALRGGPKRFKSLIRRAPITAHARTLRWQNVQKSTFSRFRYLRRLSPDDAGC